MSYTPYSGAIYTYPGGAMAGVPWDVYQKYLRDKQIYGDLGIPVPRFLIVVKEPDGTAWEYTFSYETPFGYLSKSQIPASGAYVPSIAGITPVKFNTTQDMYTPSGVYVPPDEVVPSPVEETSVTVITIDPVDGGGAGVSGGGGGSTVSVVSGGGWGDIAKIGALLAGALALSLVLKKK